MRHHTLILCFLCVSLCWESSVLALAILRSTTTRTHRDGGDGPTQRTTLHNNNNNNNDYYDLVIIGAGASGGFASGAAASFGLKTLLLDQGKGGFIGGDCTNAACVPSKALRSIARSSRHHPRDTENNKNSVFERARNHTFGAVMAVRNREVFDEQQVPNLDLVLVESCRFVSENEIEILPQQQQQQTDRVIRRVRAKTFLLATGASPFIPTDLELAAAKANLPLYTYRDVLSPDSDHSFWDLLLDNDNNSIPTTNSTTSTTTQNPLSIVIAGGGPTAVELGQSLARLNKEFHVTIIAPTLLPEEDVSLQQAACQVLRNDEVHLILGRRVDTVTKNQQVKLDDGTELKANAMIVCHGRKPTISSLNLEAANIKWDETLGVHVNPKTLQSRTNPRVFACGDCCSAVTGKNRKAAHAAWTGYYVIRNIALPRILLWGASSIHPTVPSVTYTDPELASVGLTRGECVKKYGNNGFLYQSIREGGMDRADMERGERFVNASFVELRAERISGRIVGMTACGPAAAELANEIGLAIQNKLTVRDLARSIHSYPSHGYLLYRLGLSMALSSTRGFLETLGPIGCTAGRVYGGLGSFLWRLRPGRIFRKQWRKKKQWEAMGVQHTVIASPSNDHSDSEEGAPMPISFIEYYHKQHQYRVVNNEGNTDNFTGWVDLRPKKKGRWYLPDSLPQL